MTEPADRTAQHSSGPAGSGLELRIDELVLHGFRPGDRYAIAEAVQRELGRLFTEAGVPPGLAARERELFRLDAGSFEMAHAATPDAVGTQVAGALYRSLGGLNEPGARP